MARRKPNINNVNNFRTPDDEGLFFNTITCVEHRQQTTPFIFMCNGDVHAINYTYELFKVANDNDIILKAWVGKWKTDIFAFKVGDLKEYIDKNNISII